MRIRTRLVLAACAPPLAAALIGLAIYLSHRETEQAQQRGRAAQQIATSMHDLNGLAYSYLLHREERPREQFLAEHERVTRLLGDIRAGDSRQQQLLKSMRRNSTSVRESFLRLVSSGPQVGDDPLFREADERLAGRMLTRSRAVVSDALRLENLTDDEITVTQRRTNTLVLAVIIAVTAPLTLGLVHMMRSITASLAMLREGTEIIGAGSLDHRIAMAARHELGDLARSFDRMTERLRAVTVSRNELQREVEERRRAEAGLAEANERLQAQSEELQAQQEELVAANEELQAQQEELVAANEELQAQQDELAAANEDLRESEQRARYLASFPERNPHPVLETDLDGRVTYENSATGALFPDLAALGTDHPFLQDIGAVVGRLQDEGASSVSREVRCGDTVFHQAIHRVSESQVIRLYCLDITDRKRAEDALRDADRRKDEFLAMLSHELRNPLAAISNAVQFLLRGGTADRARRKACEAAVRQTQHMARLLDDLLDVSRITRGKVVLRVDDVDLLSVVDSAVEASSPLVEARGHRLTLSLPGDAVWVRGDAVRLAQVVGNLLNNAAKYTPPGGEVHLSLQRDNDEAIIRVRDNGDGIDAGTLPHIFSLFVQGDTSVGRTQSGLGIGLTMVRSLVEMHGGHVSAHSAGRDKGTEVTVRLPIQGSGSGVQGSGSEAPSPAVVASGRKMRILVVDDNADAAELLAMALEMDGHEVSTAHSGAAALDAIAAYRPDAVLLDIGMPGMDGYEVARRLRQEPALCQVTLVALTGYGQDEDRERTRSAGFDYHLVKPVDMDALREVLRQVPVG